MRRAVGRSGEILSAQDADGAGFSCPVCGSDLVLRRGRIRSAHFAHRTGEACRWRPPSPARGRRRVIEDQLALFPVEVTPRRRFAWVGRLLRRRRSGRQR